ncbi:MAG TPA: DUF4175 family protein, partial [Parapedobacter sp.]|nr:DUF4175 family protein [Parapedobacter sp.]
MDNTGGAWITTCRNRWLTYQLLTRLLYAFAATLVVAAVLTPFGHIAPWLYPLICLGCFAALAYAPGGMKTDKHHVAAMLNKQFPTLEYSTALLLRPKNTLGPLQQLQVTRLHRSIADIRIGQFANPRVLTGPAVTALVALCVYLAIANLHVSTAPHNGADAIAAAATIPDTPLPPSVADARIVISPPRYTGLPQATQNHLEITAPTGSMISIMLTTTAPVAQMKARFDGKEERRFTAVSADSLQWELEIEPRKSGFFQLELDGEPSALYPLSVTPDLPISIRVNTPEQHTVIDYGFPERINLSAFLQDDYAISSAAVVTTISSGKGEGVSFKSGEIPFNNSVNGQKEV